MSSGLFLISWYSISDSVLKYGVSVCILDFSHPQFAVVKIVVSQSDFTTASAVVDLIGSKFECLP